MGGMTERSEERRSGGGARGEMGVAGAFGLEKKEILEKIEDKNS